MLLVVMAATWKQISYNFLFFLAGLQSIPRSLVEAAAIDGAGPRAVSGPSSFRCCRRPPSFCSSSTSCTRFFDTFGVIDSTTQGGPAGATQILV